MIDKTFVFTVFNGIFTDVGIPHRRQVRLRKALAGISKDLEFISKKENSAKERRKRMLRPQIGSGIGLLLSALIPAISSIVSAVT